MRDVSQLALIGAVAVVSLVAPVANGFHLPRSSTAGAGHLLRHREHHRHRHPSSTRFEAGVYHNSEPGWVVDGGTGLLRRGSAGGAAFHGGLRMMMAESGDPPAKKGKGKGPYKVIANNK